MSFVRSSVGLLIVFALIWISLFQFHILQPSETEVPRLRAEIDVAKGIINKLEKQVDKMKLHQVFSEPNQINNQENIQKNDIQVVVQPCDDSNNNNNNKQQQGECPPCPKAEGVAFINNNNNNNNDNNNNNNNNNNEYNSQYAILSSSSAKNPLTLTDLERECDLDHGESLLENWRASEEVLCDGAEGRILFYGQDATKGFKRRYAGGLRSFHLFGASVDPSGVNMVMVDGGTDHPPQTWSGGSIRVSCSPQSRMHANGFEEGFLNGIWKEQSIKLRGFSVGKGQCRTTLKGATLFVTRDAWLNNFHVMADVYLAYLQAKMIRKPIRIIVTDGFPKGPWWPLWDSLSELDAAVHWRDISSAYPGPICFEELILPPASGASVTWEAWDPSPCSTSLLFQQFPRVMLQRMNLLNVQRPNEVVITFVSRKGASSRLMRNEDYLADKLNTFPHIRAQVVEFAKISAMEQFEVVRKSSILIGTHGAGMTHMLFLHPDSAVIEIHPRLLVGTQSVMYIYRNMAKWLGLLYVTVRNRNSGEEDRKENYSIDEQDFLNAVDTAVRHVRNSGRGMTMCGLDCGHPPKPRLWTPINYELEKDPWIRIHDDYEKSHGWPHSMPNS